MIFKITSSTIIAVAAVILVFGIISSLTLGGLEARCTMEKNVIRHIPLPGYANRPLSAECNFDPSGERKTVDELTNILLARYVEKCWESGENGAYGKDIECFELYAKRVTEPIDEETVSDTLKSRGTCEVLENSELEMTGDPYDDCGTENQLFWRMEETIADKTTIIVKYNTLAQRIEII